MKSFNVFCLFVFFFSHFHPTTHALIALCSSKTSLSGSSGDDEDQDLLEPGMKAVREKERRQANNARERYRHTNIH